MLSLVVTAVLLLLYRFWGPLPVLISGTAAARLLGLCTPSLPLLALVFAAERLGLELVPVAVDASEPVEILRLAKA